MSGRGSARFAARLLGAAALSALAPSAAVGQAQPATPIERFLAGRPKGAS